MVVESAKTITLESAGLLTRFLADSLSQSQVHEPMSLNDLEFAYAPVRNQVRDLREYL